MPSALPSRLRTPCLAIVAAGLSGAALYLGAGLRPVDWLVWLAPIPVLWAAPRLGAKTAFAASAAAWVVGSISQWSYLASVHLPVPVIVLATTLPALVFGAGTALSRVFARRGAALRAALALPVVWVPYELVQVYTSSHGTFGSLAYTQADALPVVQLAAVFGLSGVTFALLFFPAAAAVVLTGAVPRARRLRLAAGAGAAAVAVMGFGLWRLRAPPPGEPVVTVGLAASDLRANGAPIAVGASGRRLLGDHLTQAEDLARQGAGVVVLPEVLAELDGPAAADMDPAIQAVADRSGATLVFGVVRAEGARRFNEARVYRRGSPVPAAYHKRHLLPGFESRFTPGTDRLTVNAPGGPFGVAICKDMDFPETGRGYRADRVALLLVPAWDFGVDGWLHARMAVLRGVEGGFGVARSARRGLLTVSDDRGRVLAERRSDEAPFATLVAAVPARHTPTVYARIGDVFGWANLAALVALLGSALGAGRREGPAPLQRAA